MTALSCFAELMHRYSATVAWSGSTGVGYDRYDRRHAGISKAGYAVPLSADAAFLGDPACLNPEELLVLAAASCQLLSFLAVAARARIDVIDYRDEGAGEMPQDALTQITLRPQITVSSSSERPVTQARIHHLCQVAHRECYVAGSLRTPILVEPTVTICPSSDRQLTHRTSE
jgi:organic hydroperoxide reductase OsmC/OhrA